METFIGVGLAVLFLAWLISKQPTPVIEKKEPVVPLTKEEEQEREDFFAQYAYPQR